MLLAILAIACTPADSGPGETTETGVEEQATYRASALVGALDRIHLVRETDDLCVALGLVSPGGVPPVDLEVPDPWAVEFAWANRRLDTSPCWEEAPAEPAWCQEGEGVIELGEPGGSGYPATLSVDATLRWPEADRPEWVPDSVHLLATDVPVAAR